MYDYGHNCGLGVVVAECLYYNTVGSRVVGGVGISTTIGMGYEIVRSRFASFVLVVGAAA